jgi:hypothetical protein
LRGYVRHADLFKEHAGAADREMIFHAKNGVIGVGPAPAPAWRKGCMRIWRYSMSRRAGSRCAT